MPIAEISNRLCIDVTGEDAFSFLQGLITNDLKSLEGQDALYACFLTPQGKFLHDFLITKISDGYRLEALRSESDDLIKRLKMYKLRSKANLKVRDDLKVYALWGDDIADIGYQDPRLADLGKRYISDEPLDCNTDFNDYDLFRIKLGVPDGGRDLTTQLSTLYDANIDLLNGVSFDKGCYLGQELTARMHYRALIKKRLLPIETNEKIPAEDKDIISNNRPIGKIYSRSGTQALVCLKIKDINGALFLDDGTEVHVQKPHWLTI